MFLVNALSQPLCLGAIVSQTSAGRFQVLIGRKQRLHLNLGKLNLLKLGVSFSFERKEDRYHEKINVRLT